MGPPILLLMHLVLRAIVYCLKIAINHCFQLNCIKMKCWKGEKEEKNGKIVDLRSLVANINIL